MRNARMLLYAFVHVCKVCVGACKHISTCDNTFRTKYKRYIKYTYMYTHIFIRVNVYDNIVLRHATGTCHVRMHACLKSTKMFVSYTRTSTSVHGDQVIFTQILHEHAMAVTVEHSREVPWLKIAPSNKRFTDFDILIYELPTQLRPVAPPQNISGTSAPYRTRDRFPNKNMCP